MPGLEREESSWTLLGTGISTEEVLRDPRGLEFLNAMG